MKYYKFILVLLLFSTKIGYSQTQFNKGFEAGYKNGYCYNKSVGCISPIPPIAPIPKIGESLDSYQDGYNNGFEKGLSDGKSNSTQNNNSTNDRIRNKTYSAEPIDYIYKPNAEYNEIRIQFYNVIYPEMVDYFKNGNYDEVIKRAESLIKVKMGNSSVYEFIGASYCNLNKKDNAKFYLKKAIKLGSKNAQHIYKECIGDVPKNEANKLLFNGFINVGYNKLANDNFKSNLTLKGGYCFDAGIGLIKPINTNYSFGVSLSFLQSLWWYNYYNVSNIQSVNIIRGHLSNYYYIDNAKRYFLLGCISLGKTISAKNTNSTTTKNIDFFSNIHTSINIGIGSKLKLKNRYVLVTPNFEYQLNKHFDNNSSQANIYRVGILFSFQNSIK